MHSISFEEIGNRLFEYTSGLYQSDHNFPYPLQEGLQGSLLGTAFAVLIAHLVNRLDELPGLPRLEKEFIHCLDQEKGFISDPDIKPFHFLKPEEHSPFYVDLQTTYFSRIALKALGCEQLPEVKWISSFKGSANAIECWLDQLDWSNPWLVSNLDMFLGIFLLESNKENPTDQEVINLIQRYFKWHDAHQDAETGFWGDQHDLTCAMAGAYHILLHYDFWGQPIRYQNEIIDATLSLAWKDGLFVYGGGGGSCEDMDAIDILVRLSLLTDYKADEIKATLNRAAVAIYSRQSSDGGFSWRLPPNFTSMLKASKVLSWQKDVVKGQLTGKLFQLLRRSMYKSTHYYSSLSCYPFDISKSDLWSSWFRTLSLAFIAQRYPELFVDSCSWQFLEWPGLGYSPFLGEEKDVMSY